MYLLITYDIVSDKKRRKVDKLLSEYGYRVNYSVFELDIDKPTYTKTVEKLRQIISKRDSVRIYRHSKDTVRKSLELNPKMSDPFSKEESYVL